MTERGVKLQDIDASLTYGQIFSSNLWKGIIIFMYSSVGLVVAGIIFILIGVPLTMGQYDSNSIALIVGGSIAVVILVGSTVGIQVFFERGKKKAMLWLGDAVVVDANAESNGSEFQIRVVMSYASAIKVTFSYNGKSYERYSVYKGKPMYLWVFNKYVGRRIKIAYSPKYDEVMLIKPRNAQRIQNQSE